MQPGDPAAYQLDRAAWEFGEWLDAMLALRDKHGQPKHKLSNLLAATPTERERDFAPLAGKSVKKMAVPASGVW